MLLCSLFPTLVNEAYIRTPLHSSPLLYLRDRSIRTPENTFSPSRKDTTKASSMMWSSETRTSDPADSCSTDSGSGLDSSPGVDSSSRPSCFMFLLSSGLRGGGEGPGEPGPGEPDLGEPDPGEPGLGEPDRGEPDPGEPGLGDSASGTGGLVRSQSTTQQSGWVLGENPPQEVVL